MDTLLSKLTDLAYEFFGVVLPGIIFGIFITVLWVSIAPMLTFLTLGHMPDLTFRRIGLIEEAFSATRRVEVAILLLIAIYFLGQSLNWVSRGRSGDESRPWWRRLVQVRLARPKEAFAVELKSLFDAVAEKIAPQSTTLDWSCFYPVAKSLIAQKLTYSLVQTYQHKYTLHRCISAAGVVMSRACGFSIVVGLVMTVIGHGPDWWLLLLLTAVSLAVARAFEKSYSYFWQLWGSTVVTEAYGLLCVTGIAEKSETK